jgi:DNA repair exonuclease SbcCD nuclease subunit
MKILHLADTHLGYSAYRKVTNEGINQREVDIYQSFTQVIDYAIKQHVNLVLHAGDLFNSVRPNNRAITIALKQILRLSKNNIPIVIIAGNHEQPKLQETGHIFEVFDHIPNVYPIFNEKYETINLTLDSNLITIHCLPQINVNNTFQEQLNLIKKNENVDYNIFLSHGSIKGIRELSMNEFNEMQLPKQYLSEIFDYVALGHYHTQTKIDDFAYYSGAIDTFSFSDANTKHGFIEITLTTEKKETVFKSIKTRPFIDTPKIDCYAKNIEEIMKEILQTIQKIQPENKIFRINLFNITSQKYRSLDFRKIRNACQSCFHYEINPNIEDQKNKKGVSQGKIDSLIKEYIEFIKGQELPDQEHFLKTGLKYLSDIRKQEDS